MTSTSFLATAFCFLTVVFIATTSAAAPAPPPVNFTCPTNTNSFKPCGCKPWNSLRGVELDCRSRGLNDVKIIQVLNNFKPEKGSPLVSLNAYSNSLTKVPAEISKFPSLSFISFNVNKIKSLPFNAFNLPDVKNISIILADNEIHSVAPGAFNFPSATNLTVSLSANRLKSFSASAFKGNGTHIKLLLGGNNGLASSSVDKTLKDCPGCNITWIGVQ